MIIFKSTLQMKTYIELLFEKYNISEKNKYEILQIYNILPDNKKQNLIINFERLSYEMTNIEESINIEREILIGWAVERIRNSIFENRKQKVDQRIKEEMNLLKQKI